MTREKYRFIKKCKNFLVFYCLISILFISSYTFSRYVTTTEGSSSLQVAKPVLSLNKKSETCSFKNMIPGGSNKCEFSVSNEDENSNKNEVLLKYYLVFTFDTEIPLSAKLYRKVSDTERVEVTVVDGKTDYEYLNYVDGDEVTTKDYVIEVVWDEDFNNYLYANLPIKVNVELFGKQVISGEE